MVCLHEALAGQQFWVAFQPIVDLSSGSIYKAEALLRWNHPVLGVVSPAAFIPIAEEIGLIHPLSDWVFDQVTRHLLDWRARLCPQLQISINVSPLHFQNSHYQTLWLDHLHRMGLAGESLAIEITEGLLLDSRPMVTTCLSNYRNLGVEISLDDFGTGYSALSYLKKFDIDYLKIDQSFVRQLATDPRDLSLCEAIVVMAHKLGLRVIAEGVEPRRKRKSWRKWAAIWPRAICSRHRWRLPGLKPCWGNLFPFVLPDAGFAVWLDFQAHLRKSTQPLTPVHEFLKSAA